MSGRRSGSDLSLSSSSDTQSLMSYDASFDLRPHRSSDSATRVSLRHFRLLRRIGSGDIGTVYLCQLPPSDCLYAMKVVDKDVVALKKKAHRAETERNVLRMVDHPFLPTLFAHFDASHFSCIVMEYCSGGDLHSLRHNHPNKRFPLSTARFYAAEVLLALEYLHLLGIIYRDLKPENVLVRSDGHIMLTDFDLSLCSHAIPAVYPSAVQLPKRAGSLISRLMRRFFRHKIPTTTKQPLPLFVAEPVAARSVSFVGTHEYVSPEVASGGSHGNAVDWWAFGVFLYEMMYGHTPFAAISNEATLRNIVRKPVRFPPDQAPRSMLELQARDLIFRLLTKDPSGRLGSKHGAADIKGHPFFKGFNFALIRSVAPPVIPARQTTLEQRKSRQHLTAFHNYF